MTPATSSNAVRSLRIWPGVAAAVLLVLLRFVMPVAVRELFFEGLIGSLICMIAVIVWWLFFSRAPWPERLAVVGLTAVMMIGFWRLLHISMATGNMGILYWFYALPVVSVFLVIWAVVSRGRGPAARWALLVVALGISAGGWTLLRTEGTTSTVIGSDFRWRWSPTPEERLLAHAQPMPLAPPATAPQAAAAPAAATAPEVATAVAAPAPAGPAPGWPGFRGAARNGIVTGVRINTDWTSSPPVELWRRPIGPGWSSFSVRGDLIYTQEQRGDDEVVACYRMSTGEPVWQHRDAVRFWESNGGAGPRATPTLHGGRVYSFGATGILNALDAATGARIWSADAAKDTGREIPMWGFTSSPLVVEDIVVVAAAGTLAAYAREDGTLRWKGPSYGGSYSSPHMAEIEGMAQVILLGGPGAIGVAPADGAVLWQHEWSSGAIVQPGVLPDGDLLVNAITSTGGTGTRRLHITRQSGTWVVTERWTSTGLKPYFNDFVVHKGHAFGFDNNILASINLEDGARNWKGGRYGDGQLVLLADQDLLLVMAEEGDIALVSATTDRFTELARMPALDGKTWNHPVVVGDTLLVRNGQEMAAFRLPLSAAAPAPRREDPDN